MCVYVRVFGCVWVSCGAVAAVVMTARIALCRASMVLTFRLYRRCSLLQVFLASEMDAAEARLSWLSRQRAQRAYDELFPTSSAHPHPNHTAPEPPPLHRCEPARVSTAFAGIGYHVDGDGDGGTGGVLPVSQQWFADDGWHVGSSGVSENDAVLAALANPSSGDASLDALLGSGDGMSMERGVLLDILDRFRAVYRRAWNVPFTREVMAHMSNIPVAGPGELCPDVSLTGPHGEQVLSRSAIVLALARRAFTEYQLQLVDPQCVEPGVGVHVCVRGRGVTLVDLCACVSCLSCPMSSCLCAIW